MNLLSHPQDVVQESVDSMLQQGLRQLHNVIANGTGPLEDLRKSLAVKLCVVLICVAFTQPHCTAKSGHCIKCIITLIQLEMRLRLNCVRLEQLGVQRLGATCLLRCECKLLLTHVRLGLLQCLRRHSGDRLGVSCLHLWRWRHPLLHLPPFARGIRAIYSTHIIVHMVLTTRFEFLSTITQIPKAIAKPEQPKISAILAV
mmetsp:Transcript_53239/g.116882  ORF Transcript_53239/g.116882 Transcript_53239/m.116882 type:complete len:201 (+) Transcript_53239:1158-1760(+)